MIDLEMLHQLGDQIISARHALTLRERFRRQNCRDQLSRKVCPFCGAAVRV